MAYQRTTWRTEETPLSAANFNNIEDGIEEALEAIANLASTATDIFYPVGSHYETTDSEFNPNESWGGTWSCDELKQDYIKDQGSSNGWSWRKWESGIYEAEKVINYGQVSATQSLATIEGTKKLYASGPIPVNVPAPPHTLTSGEIEYEVLGNSLGYSFVFRTQNNKIQLGRIAAAPSEAVFTNVQLLYRVVRGRWKTYVAPPTLYRWYRSE